MAEDKRTFESAFNRLEKLVSELENGESTLEDTLKTFAEGMDLLQYCNDQLDKAEMRIDKLTRNEDGGFQLDPMETT